MESASPADHFASRFPHHSRIDEGGALKLQANNVAMAKVLVTTNSAVADTLPYGTTLKTLSDELNRFSINLPAPTSTPTTTTTTNVTNNLYNATTIPHVPLAVKTTTTTDSSSSIQSSELHNSTKNHPNQATPNQNQRNSSSIPVGATKKTTTATTQPLIIHHKRHLVPIKAQSIDISEVRFGERDSLSDSSSVRIITPSLSEEEEEAEREGRSASTSAVCDFETKLHRSTSSEPCEAASIKGMISKIKSLDRPIYPNVPYSPYSSPFSSPRAFRRTNRPPLRESRRISIEQSGSFLQLNQYKLMDQIGQGSYGLVKLAYSEEDSTHYAMKILSKRKLLRRAGLIGRGPKKSISPLDRVYREIAVLKKLDHPNVVKLVEVLDDPIDDSLYLVFELVKEGEVLSIPTDRPLTEERVWCVFRDVVLGLEYLHCQRIIHGDLKPGNLLLGECGQVKIADLGVCNEFIGEDAMNNGSSSGTPAFRSPETLKLGNHSWSGKASDIWALGATLFALIYGNVPFLASNIPALYEKIKQDPIHFPPTFTQHSPELKELILRMLEKDPDKRITLSEIKEHNWVTANQTYPLPTEEDNCCQILISDEELNSVVKSIPKLDTLILIKTMLKKHSFQNPFQFQQKPMSRTSQRGVSRLERFRAGRSNSAPGAYHATLQKQFSTETCLPSLLEGCVVESFKEEAIPENDPQQRDENESEGSCVL